MLKITNLLSIILVITLSISCINNKPDQNLSVEENSYYQTPPFELKTIPEGILISLGDIPDDITSIYVDIYNWGDRVYTFQKDDYPLRRDAISSSIAHIEGECLERIKQTKSIIFPFIKQGEKYNVLVIYFKSGIDCASTVFSQIIAENGIYLENDIELLLNANNTSVRLSEAPKFTSNVVYSDNTHSFSFYMFNDENTSVYGGISTEHNTRDISWDFEPIINEQIKRSKSSYKSGGYTAFIEFSINIIYDNIEWQNYFIKSPRFDYSVK